MGLGRRSFLHSGFLSLSAFGFSSYATAEPEQPEAFVVPAGKCRIDGPWTVHGEPSFFDKISGTDVGGRMSVIEVKTPPGQGPPMHIHLEQNEWMYLLEGSFGLQCGTEKTVLHTGDSFMAPRGIPHSYVVLGDAPARHLNIYDPAGEIEAFFRDYEKNHSPGAKPDPEKAAESEKFYRVRVVGPPLKPSAFAKS
jgi:quercetin dioxygenase-like cupin family protein